MQDNRTLAVGRRPAKDESPGLLAILFGNLIFWAIVGLIPLGVVFGHQSITWIGLGFLLAFCGVAIVVALVAGTAIGVTLLHGSPEGSWPARAMRWVLMMYFLGGPVFIVCASAWLWYQ